ncbi:uncharacterized protein K02A2.6-like [Rhagoletis pomonella]|uniref:uncharacterized protein K02A2.6-like n=1 Tax=Rhagoletis pomonella TaxID=28610 RepID=UPI00177D73DD|nr:uncharacterized protein K02A2.6-like [Rhagoletis pomonella]
MLANIDATAAYIDDIIVGGSTWENHLQNLFKVLQRLREYNFHVKLEKCKFYAAEVKYLGNIVSQCELRPDPDKISAILKMPPPTNISELRAFLGSVNYYGKFDRSMSSVRAPLDALLHDNMNFVWTSQCQQAFEKFKSILQSDLLLTHYNPDLPIKVAADASGKGIGAFICHIMPDSTERVIAHAACTLSSTEQKYSQIEEALFHRYIFGRRFILWTDHKPLLSIFGSKKGIPAHTANRLQRWALILMRYDYELQYVNTKNFGCVDTLSRLMDKNEHEDMVIACTQLEQEILAELNDQIRKLPVTFSMVLKATSKCKQLEAVLKALKSGWPANVPYDLLPYHRRKDSLSAVRGCLLFGERIIIPDCPRKRDLCQLHRGHPGKERMQSIARRHVFWPDIDEEIV